MNTTALLLGLAFVLFLVAVFLVIWVLRDGKRSKSGGTSHPKANSEEMSHMIVHDLRAPVVAIKDSANLLLSGNLNTEDAKGMMELIVEQSDKLLFEISTILDAAKVNQGKLTLKKTSGSIGVLVNEEIKLFASEAKNKNITVTANVSPAIPDFFFDKVRITEAISNILSNSLKYTNDNGLIKITVRPQGKDISIVISDNGVGIPEDKKKDLFKKYSQLNSSHQKISSGLGLYITKWIIDAHKGEIHVESKEGEGTTTFITLPMATKPS